MSAKRKGILIILIFVSCIVFILCWSSKEESNIGYSTQKMRATSGLQSDINKLRNMEIKRTLCTVGMVVSVVTFFSSIYLYFWGPSDIKEKVGTTKFAYNPIVEANKENELEEKLQQLKNLHEKNLISTEEYDVKRKELLDNL